MPSWALVLILVAATLLAYFLLGLLFHHLMNKAELRVFQELEKKTAYEQERGKKVLACLEKIESRGFRFDQKAKALIIKGSSDFKGLTYEEKFEYKNNVDFSSMFLVKVQREDKKFGPYLTKEEGEEMNKMREESQKEYKDYNKAAMRYNVYMNMVFTRGISALKKEKKQSAYIF